MEQAFELSPLGIFVDSDDSLVTSIREVAEEIPCLRKRIPFKKVFLEVGDPEDTPWPRVAYQGDFPEGDWEFAFRLLRCRKKGGNVDCVLFRDAGLKERVVMALKIITSDLLPFADGLVLHASAVDTLEGARVFIGPSGAGKSTISTLVEGMVVTDDFAPLVFDESSELLVFPSAFARWEGRLGGKEPARVVGIYVLKKADEWRLTPLSMGDAIKEILRNTNNFCELPKCRTAILDMAIRIASTTPVWLLEFSLDKPSKDFFSRTSLQ